MNTKRQTIWLVSMLSLMVILSAYYLFTQDLTGKDKLSDATQGENGAIVASNNVEEDEEYTITDADQQVLNQLQAEGYFGGSVIGELMTKRESKIEDEENRLMAVLADTNNDTDTTLEAWKEVEQLEAKMEKVSKLEDSLKENYEVVLISEEVNDKYKVVVTSDKAEKKEAAAIIEQVIAELELRPNQVYVEFIANP